MALLFPALARALAVSLVGVSIPLALHAGEADIVGVKVTRTAPQVYRFEVTVRHGDTGWEHYADKWDVLAPDGKSLGTRVLLHPHEAEQPFTRSLSGVRVAKGVGAVTIRAHDKVHGYGGAELRVEIPR
jgi:hypothetical protein